MNIVYRMNMDYRNKVMSFERFSIVEPFNVRRKESETREAAIERF